MNDMFKQMEDLFLQVDKLNKKITKMDNEHKVESKIKDQKIEKCICQVKFGPSYI